MATFAQDPQPQNDPNYIFWSRPAREQPRGSEAGKIVGEETGKLIGEGTKVGDEVVKKNIEDNVYDTVNKERGAFTNALSNVKDLVTGQDGTQQPKMDILDSKNQPPPDEVKTAVNNVANLQNGKAAGKINETYYYQRLIPQLQSIRDRFPGYRDYIDEQVHKITGVDPANAYMRSLLQDINQRKEAGQQEHNRGYALLSRLAENQDPHVSVYAQQWEQGKITYPQLLGIVSKSVSFHDRLEMDKWKEHEADRTKEQAATDVEHRAYYAANGFNSEFIQATHQGAGISTPQQIADHINYASTHPGEYSEAAVQNFGRQMQTFQTMADQKYREWANTPDSDGQSPMQKNPKAVEAASKQIKDWYEQYIQRIGDPKTLGLGIAMAETAKSIKDGDKITALTSPDIGAPMRRFEIVPQAVQPLLAQQYMSEPKWTTGVANFNIDTLGDMYGQAELQKGNPFTIGTAVKRAADNLPGYTVPSSVQSYLHQADFLQARDTDPKAKENLATAFFAPTAENRALITQFNDASKWQVFSKLTSPGMTKAMVKIGLHNPELFTNYKNTTEAWFDSLVQKNVLPTLKEAEDSWGKGSTHAEFAARHGQATQTQQGIQYYWDADNHRLGITPQSLSFIKKAMPDTWQQSPLIQSLAKFNVAMSNISHIQKAADVDPNVYLLELLQHEGVNVDASTREAMFKISQAILNSKTKKNDLETEEEEDVNRNK